MPSQKDALLEALLAAAAMPDSETEENDSDDEGKAPSGTAENSTIKAIRAEAKRAEKRAAAAEAEAAELRKFKEEATARQREAQLAAAGLTKAQADVFAKAFDEVTDENLRVFKSDVLGVREAPEDEEGLAPNSAFAPAAFSSERTPEVVSGKADVAAFVEKFGVEAAEKAWQEGKLKL